MQRKEDDVNVARKPIEIVCTHIFQTDVPSSSRLTALWAELYQMGISVPPVSEDSTREP